MKLPITASVLALCVLATAGTPPKARAQDPAQARLAAQSRAMAALAPFEGAWRGPAKVTAPDGTVYELIQTERFGPFLDGSVRMVEGRGFDRDGRLRFNALGIIAFAPDTGTYSMRTYTRGETGDVPMTVRPGEFEWTTTSGGATVRYRAWLENGEWVETGERTVPGQPPVRFFEMRLRRIGDTDWPLGTPVGPR